MIVDDRPATYGEVFADRAFRVLFVARMFTSASTSLQIFALSVLVYATTGSPFLSALAFGAGFLPQVVGGLLLGSLTDRWPPRPLIVTGYALSAAVFASLGALPLPVPVSLAMVALLACGTPVFTGAATQVIAERLTGDAYVLGRSLSSMSSSIAQLLGLAGGGVAVAALGPRSALLLAAGCEALSAVIVRFGLPSLAAPVSTKGRLVQDSWEGSVALWSDRTVRRLLLAQWLPPAFVTGAESLLVSYATGQGFPPTAAAALMSGLPMGMLLGYFVLGRFVTPSRRERLFSAIIFLLGAPLIGFLAAPGWPLAVALSVMSGCGFAYSLGLQRAFLAAAPDGRRGQMFALHMTGLMALQGLGPLALGALAQFTSPALAIAAAGTATVALAFTL